MVIRTDFGKEIREIWATYIGSRKLTMHDELRALRDLEGVLPWHIRHQLYLETKRWQTLRKQVLDRDKACVRCGATQQLHVDHKQYAEHFGNETIDDLQVLCANCHAEKTESRDLLAGKESPKVKMKKQLFSVLRGGING